LETATANEWKTLTGNYVNRLILRRRQGRVPAVLVVRGISKRFTAREKCNPEIGALNLIVLRWADMLGAATLIIRLHRKECQMMQISKRRDEPRSTRRARRGGSKEGLSTSV
jgi:hypothetical protein